MKKSRQYNKQAKHDEPLRLDQHPHNLLLTRTLPVDNKRARFIEPALRGPRLFKNLEEDKMAPPIHTEHFHIDGATALIVVVNGTNAVNFACDQQSLGKWSCCLATWHERTNSRGCQRRTSWNCRGIRWLLCQWNLAGTIYRSDGNIQRRQKWCFCLGVRRSSLCRLATRNWRTTPCGCTRHTSYCSGKKCRGIRWLLFQWNVDGSTLPRNGNIRRHQRRCFRLGAHGPYPCWFPPSIWALCCNPCQCSTVSLWYPEQSLSAVVAKGHSCSVANFINFSVRTRPAKRRTAWGGA